MAVTLNLEVLIATRHVQSGAVFAFPVAARHLVARGDDEATALELQREFLGKLLTELPAQKLAAFVYPEDAGLEHVEALLPRADLPLRNEVQTSVAVPVIVIPEAKDKWVHVLPFVHTAFLRAGEDAPLKLRQHVEAAAAMRKLGDEDYGDALPGVRHGLVRVPIVVERPDRDDRTARAGARRHKVAQRERDEGIELLNQVGRNLLRHGQREAIVGRNAEIEGLAALLSGAARMSVALVGPPLVGKTSLLAGLLSQRVVAFRSRPVFATSGAQLVAGQSGFGDLDERVDKVMRAVERLDAVLYFDNLGDLFAGHSGGIQDLAAAMRPWVTSGRVRILGELTPEQWEHHEKRHVGFFSALHRVSVEPLGLEATREVLRERVAAERKRGLGTPCLAPAAIEPLLELSARYLAYQAFPGKALRVYEELQAVHEGERAPDGGPRILEKADVYTGFSQRTGIPLLLLREEQAMRAAEVEAYFHQRIIGQHAAIERVAQTLCMVKAGLQAPAKPLATFLFVGPTGVGKTEVAKTLARFLFGSAERLIRFDMSEYMDPWAAERLIRGTGSEEGELTRRVRQQPFCVVLLDELEKASPAVFDLLLQVCGEGRLSDAKGRTTFFHNAILIMTSNLGASHRRLSSPGFGDASAPRPEDDERYYIEQVERNFRPEFVNRIDRIIPFHALSGPEIAAVARVTLDRVKERAGLVDRSASLQVSELALSRLATAGYSARYGARALRRTFEDELVTVVAEAVTALGVRAQGASFSVSCVSEKGPAEVTPFWEAERGDLRILAHALPAAAARQLSGGVEWIADLRRLAAYCCAAPAIEAMRERVDYIVADLARPGGDGSAPVDHAGLMQEHARLSGLLAAVDEPFSALLVAEELAIVAQAEGDPSGLFREDAEAAFAAFESAFIRAVLGPADRATLLVRGVEGAWATFHWLEPFLRGAHDRGWNVAVHRHGDPLRDEPSWPTNCAFGPPRAGVAASGMIAALGEEDDASAWQTVVVCVRGPFAGALLRQEAGLHRYARVDQGAGEAWNHVEVTFVLPEASVSAAELATETFALPERLTHGDARKASAVRIWQADRSLEIPQTGIELGPEIAANYWIHLERVLFGVLAGPAIAGDDFTDEA